MRYYPLFSDLKGKTVIVAGAGETAVSKLRLLLKTEATIRVYGQNVVDQVAQWHDEHRLDLVKRTLETKDLDQAFLLYCATEDDELDARFAQWARQKSVLVNVVDDAENSDFITPAIVDRDPVTIAIGTEGTAPVLARKIKSDLEEKLPASLGKLARLAETMRGQVNRISDGKRRRQIWEQFFFGGAVKKFEETGNLHAQNEIEELIQRSENPRADAGNVTFVGAGPGDPDLLTVKARKQLLTADVIIHDRLVSAEILELVRREAIVIETGKTGFGPSWKQAAINQLMITHAQNGNQVVRLKSGDPSVYGRLDEELEALDQADVGWSVVPGITSASAAAATLGASLTRRDRNSEFRFLTGHDCEGFSWLDWKNLAKPDAVAAIYMAKKAAGFISGRLLMHGASETTPVTVVENVSRANQRAIETSLAHLPATFEQHDIKGPAILMFGLKNRTGMQAEFNDERSRLAG